VDSSFNLYDEAGAGFAEHATAAIAGEKAG